MKIAEIKEMTTNDLAQIKQLSRTISRMKTELRQRELNYK